MVRKGNVCDIVFWTDKDEKEVAIPVDDRGKVTVFYKHGKTALKNTVYSGCDELFAQYDVLQTTEYNQMQSWILAKKYPEKHIVYHGPYYTPFNKRYNLMCTVFDLFFLNRYRKIGTHFITKSKLAQEFLGSKGIKASNVKTIGVGIDTQMLSNGKTECSEPLFLEMCKDEKVKLLYIGRFEERRNIPFIFDIFAEILKKSVNATLYMIGTGDKDYTEKCWKHATELGIRENIVYQEKMEQSGNLLLSIINNVLDMARIESGKVELDEDYVKIRDIYQGIYKIFQAEAEKKGIHLKMEYDVKHEHVICDETKNKEIFLNLISNAVKYTASGGRVTIRITELDCDRKDYVRIRTQVIDTGIGMSEEFLPSLFEAFARERNTTDGKIAGTGLGMPIIKKYIDMMYGTIEVESKQGEGSKFTVTLEYRIADKSYYEQDTEKSSDVDETDRISGKHILLAEDNDLNAEIAQFILEDMGLIVDRVEDGVQCVSRIEQKPAGTYDLILMDIQMPNMDGYRATEMIRGLSDKDKATIPIIAMTANAFEEDRKKALAKGMNGHIAKPVDAEKVEKTICSVLGSQSEQ